MLRTPASTLPLNPEEKTQNLYRNWRERFVTPLLIVSLIFGLVALIPAVSSAFSSVISLIFITTYIITGIVAFIPFPYAIRMGAFLLIIYVLGLSELATHGILGDGLFFFLGLIIFATMMISPRVGILSMLVNLLTFVLFGFLMLSGSFTPINPNAAPATWLDWLSAAGVTVMFGVIIVFGFQRLEGEFLEAQKQIDSTLSQ